MMAASELVVSAYTSLAEALTELAMQASDATNSQLLSSRAMVSDQLAENCSKQFAGKDVPGGEDAIGKADRATSEAKAASGDDDAACKRVIADADVANGTLRAILQRSPRSDFLGLVGSLRITPPAAPAPVPNDAIMTADFVATKATTEPPRIAPPSYISAVAKLFPVEAATLFPLGLSIAGNDPVAVTIVIIVTALFVVALRYFATQVDGKPSWNEIGGALVSLLLWIGATKGYWVDRGWINLMSADQGSALFGFVTVMWVALAPYLVAEKSKRDAAAT